MKILEPVDLLYHLRLGQNALLGGLDFTQKYMPYWYCGVENGKLSGFHHTGAWDRCHDVARAIHGLCTVEEVTGDRVEESILLDLTEHLFSLFDESDDLPGTINDDTGKRFVHLHNIRETIHALTALIRRGNDRAEYWGRRMVRKVLLALDEKGKIHLERLPGYIESYNHQPSQEGRAVDALVRYYRVSEDEAALELAILMTTYALENCFTVEGALTEEAGTHGHSINALVAGMLDLALLLNDAVMLRRLKKIFDVGLPRFNSSFGWSMESLNNFTPRGESNNTGDFLRAALLLGKAGYPDYFGNAERIIRGHLLPSQVLEVERFSDEPNTEDRLSNLASRIRGGFAFPAPNDLIEDPKKDSLMVYDITSGAVDGLCEAWRAIITEDNAGIHINLLFDFEVKGVRVKSYLSTKGQVDIENTTGRNIFVRIPRWVRSADVRLKAKGVEKARRFIGSYLLIPGRDGYQAITVEFPMRDARIVESIAFKQYTIDWRGDQIVAMLPPGEYMPMFPPCP